MKKLIATLLIVLMCGVSCQSAQQSQPEQDACNCFEEAIVQGADGKTKLVLTQEEFSAMYRAAENYFQIEERVNSNEIHKYITVKKVQEGKYEVKMEMTNSLVLKVLVRVDSEEYRKLQAKMQRITTEKPKIEIERLSNSRFTITMSVDDVSFQGEIDVDAEERFHWPSYVYGMVTVGLIGLGASAPKLMLLGLGL